MCLSLTLVSSACSHEWDTYDPRLDTANAGSAGQGGFGGDGGKGGDGNGGSGGQGGNPDECGVLAPAVAPCDAALTGTFDDFAKFDADWYLAAGGGSINIGGGVAILDLNAAGDTTFAATHPDFTLSNCSIWVQIVQTAIPTDAAVRLSLSNPFATSRFSFGVLNNELHAFIDNTSVFSIPYDKAQMQYVRMREEGGSIHFGHSVDAHCWTEVFDTPNTLMGDVEGRMAVTHVPSGAGSAAEGRFDNYCVMPP